MRPGLGLFRLVKSSIQKERGLVIVDLTVAEKFHAILDKDDRLVQMKPKPGRTIFLSSFLCPSETDSSC